MSTKSTIYLSEDNKYHVYKDIRDDQMYLDIENEEGEIIETKLLKYGFLDICLDTILPFLLDKTPKL